MLMVFGFEVIHVSGMRLFIEQDIVQFLQPKKGFVNLRVTRQPLLGCLTGRIR
jgi:hypothetical protein